jgi:hypothetical protein
MARSPTSFGKPCKNNSPPNTPKLSSRLAGLPRRRLGWAVLKGIPGNLVAGLGSELCDEFLQYVGTTVFSPDKSRAGSSPPSSTIADRTALCSVTRLASLKDFLGRPRSRWVITPCGQPIPKTAPGSRMSPSQDVHPAPAERQMARID